MKITPPVFKSLRIRALYTISFLLLSFFGSSFSASAQQIAIKTNLLYDATASINLGAEVRVAPRWSIDISGNLNAWNITDQRRWKHWFIQPEARYWLCEATTGHFFAIHAIGGKYNIGHIGFARDLFGVNFSKLRDHRYQGWGAGAGIGYGYSWLLGRHWNIEAEIAVGWIHVDYDIYQCAGCGRKIGRGHENFLAPTKLAANLVYLF